MTTLLARKLKRESWQRLRFLQVGIAWQNRLQTNENFPSAPSSKISQRPTWFEKSTALLMVVLLDVAPRP
ncbi:hypothetical protein E4K66_17790 [Bradyrhizobium frederickii]|uniref:Uncharacterized protein n=1 Tax=Bradyrhizobium frederickii TaxID=2560054 RepID=A0A4Y9L6E6_9BRAD|nr:hypothetical protein [Bradyrhizobium frederickii]TFV38247.1 hypothetical protein E4K66_17790 [Bradyrhizobium frederickii]